ncbi:hypothetical protein AL542_04875 [Grimontia hollisae]|uniref:A-glycosyltransferase-related protein glycosyltransferase family 4 protein n=1 Tax=Grimontia hollisae CIP 101886 TaxID=675812 RepID=D0IC02_GRIHO|nr:glycosyltransferase family 4 protein [Grimontia hollisae]AMG29791.1 hypothetical protein AL542_04875 [Grimontia hollisae]EEY71420.1 a-glycosyltransferase-related protein glycosyltransferase family 4 protein [Grimontia hollisae CIP 101886]STO43350.1 lipopolysaccharide 1,2-N-acetylglucosaminetransferase [Grimontia hollisae]
MKIVHITLGSLNPISSNGINKVLLSLLPRIKRKHDVEIEVITVRKKNTKEIEQIEREGIKVTCCKTVNTLVNYINEDKKISIIHYHNVWSIYNIEIQRKIKDRRLPYVISPHSGFSFDRVRGSNYIAKRLFHSILQRKFLDGANAIHALCPEELYEISGYTNNTRYRIISNGIDFIPSKIDLKKNIKNKINFGFVGRIAEEKNILELVKAFHMVSLESEYELKLYLIGGYDGTYGKLVNKLISSLKIEDKVKLIGPKYGKDLESFQEKIDIYTHVSKSEGSSISILEALSKGKICVLSRTSNISYYSQHKAFLMCEPTAVHIADKMTEALSISTGNESKKMINNAYELVQSEFCWDRLVEKYHAMYKSILEYR